ncbi:terminase family protein [Nannocystis sp. ILAH1]|uniref:terminase large subunit domain-containing protein n=1 Tax=Nannocystis sp. ILAH1 TaxID=2996789 RepID=UPI0022707F04|nr:terminase family protein [Nannocystis sp. ILAH1]MCY0992822.1 terminase family protein [Nannocystis sp. ILAH1]
MTATTRQVLHRKIEEIETALGEARFLNLAPHVLVHEAAAPGSPPCRCCGSRHAVVVETHVLPEVIIDCAAGRRIYREDVSRRTWSCIQADAEQHPIPLRMSRAQAEVLLDDNDTRHVIASGGNRSGKTTNALMFLALQWLRRGGPQRRFWLVASTQPKAFRLLEKLFVGTGESPPLLPRALVRSMPDTHRASSLLTVLADGSLIDLKHFENDPGAEKLKSDAVVCAVVDEAAHLPAEDSMVALRGRTLDAGGRLFLATTPRPGHFLRDLVEQAQAFERLPENDERRASGEHEGARWRAVQFAILGNPWLDPEVVRRELAALDQDDPAVRRDFFGEWCANAGLLWRDFSVERHVHLDEARALADMRATLVQRTRGAVLDATPQVARRLFQARTNPHFREVRATSGRYILASDFNCHPMSTVVLQVAADPVAPDDRARWHVFVVDVIQSGHSHSLAHAEKLVDLKWVRTWAPTATDSPYRGCGMICDPQALSRDPTAHRHGRNPQGLAETLGRLGFDARAPQYKLGDGGTWRPVHTTRYDSHTLVHRLLREGRLHLAQRCLALVESLLQQTDSGDGIVPLTKSHTKSDRLASPLDALRYGLWAIFHGGQ